MVKIIMLEDGSLKLTPVREKEELHNTIENAAPEKVQEMLRILDICNS